MMFFTSVARFISSKQQVTVQDMLLVGCAGLFTGLVLAYGMMGSMHAVRSSLVVPLTIMDYR